MVDMVPALLRAERFGPCAQDCRGLLQALAGTSGIGLLFSWYCSGGYLSYWLFGVLLEFSALRFGLLSC